MAYVSRGFIPVNDLVYNTGMTKLFHIPASNGTNTAIFDIVKAGSSGDANGIPDCARITGINDVPVGVVVGFVADPSYLEQTYRTASTERYALVNYDPNIVLVGQEDNAGAATLALSRLGTPVDVAVGPVDTVTGTSGMQIGSGALSGAPGMFRLQQRSQDVSNPAVGGANTQWLVTFNVHQYKATT